MDFLFTIPFLILLSNSFSVKGNVVDGRQVNIQEEIKQYVEMRHMDGNNSTMKDESYRDNNILVQIPTLLKRLELKSGDIKKVKNTPIGTGGYAKVYKVKYNGEIMAAKVEEQKFFVPLLLKFL